MDGNKIEHKNILYVSDLNWIGGVETYVHEILKKYSKLDIAVVYKTAHPEQLKRIRKYCKTYKHTDQKIVCDVCIINYDVSIINYITPTIWAQNLKEGDPIGIYQGIHADYDNEYYITHEYKPPTDPRIKAYIAITKHIEDTFTSVSGVPREKIIQIYNPLTIEKKDRALILVSATRLSPEKGSKRMSELVRALDNSGIEYVWFIFTDSEHEIESPNVVYKEPTFDIGRWLDLADYLVQLSDTEGLSYSINEMLYRNKPVIVTPLHYLDELGIKDGVNCYILEKDCSNVEEIVKKISNIPKFEFKKLKDSYDKIFIKSESHYNPTEDKVTLICDYFLGFDCIKEGKHLKQGETIEVDEYRAQELLSYRGCFKLCTEEATNTLKKN